MARKILITGAEGQLGIVLQRMLGDKFDVFPTEGREIDVVMNDLGKPWSVKFVPKHEI